MRPFSYPRCIHGHLALVKSDMLAGSQGSCREALETCMRPSAVWHRSIPLSFQSLPMVKFKAVLFSLTPARPSPRCSRVCLYFQPVACLPATAPWTVVNCETTGPLEGKPGCRADHDLDQWTLILANIGIRTSGRMKRVVLENGAWIE